MSMTPFDTFKLFAVKKWPYLILSSLDAHAFQTPLKRAAGIGQIALFNRSNLDNPTDFERT